MARKGETTASGCSRDHNRTKKPLRVAVVLRPKVAPRGLGVGRARGQGPLRAAALVTQHAIVWHALSSLAGSAPAARPRLRAGAEGGEAALGPEDRPPPLWGCVGCRARPTRAARDKSSEQGLNLSGSWQQGHSAAYNTPFLIQVVCKGFIARGQEIVMAHGNCEDRYLPRLAR